MVSCRYPLQLCTPRGTPRASPPCQAPGASPSGVASTPLGDKVLDSSSGTPPLLGGVVLSGRRLPHWLGRHLICRHLGWSRMKTLHCPVPSSCHPPLASPHHGSLPMSMVDPVYSPSSGDPCVHAHPGREGAWSGGMSSSSVSTTLGLAGGYPPGNQAMAGSHSRSTPLRRIPGHVVDLLRREDVHANSLLHLCR